MRKKVSTLPPPPARTAGTLVPLELQAQLRTQGCTSLRLRQLMRRIDHHYDAEIAKAGLKTTQYSLLTYVLKFGPLRPGELAQGLKLSASTLTRNLKPLVEAGWLAVDAGTDGRSRIVSITPAGRERREQARQHWRVAQESLNRLLGVERVLALHGLINESLQILAEDDLPACDV